MVSGAEDAAVRGRFGYVRGHELGACGLVRGRQGTSVAGGGVRARLAGVCAAWRGSGGRLARGAVMAVTGSRVLAGRYVLLDVLGTGSMATVWRARDQVLGREVAVKVLSPQYAADPGFLARFEREARHAARLSHPRLVTVFDSGVDGTSAFIVMELVTGPTLRQVLDQAGPLPGWEAVQIAAAVCEALEVAHAAGLVHRDIKPANIVLAGGGEVKVLDFGIARADGGDGTTGTLGVLGTAAYLSPEQASGRAAGPQSDLYSLGCVLFEMLTGTPPFSAGTAVGLAYQQVHDDPGPPSARRPGLPGRLDQVTGRLLAKNPAAAAAGAFTGDLQAAVADGQVTPQAGQDLFNHLQQLLFGPPGQNTQRIQQQYQQLIQAYDQHQSQGQITGLAASRLRHELEALGTALGAL